MICPVCKVEGTLENGRITCHNPECVEIRHKKVRDFDGQYEGEYFNGGGYVYYEDFPAHKARAEKLISITRPTSVLDVGCAYGYIVRHLSKAGVYAHGCDVSEYCKKKAEIIIPGKFRKCNAWELPYVDNCFDLIYCEGVLEHIPEDKIEQVFSEFARVGSRCYLQVSFDSHQGVDMEPGHLTLKPPQWWYDRMPSYSWLAMDECGTESCRNWVYKV